MSSAVLFGRLFTVAIATLSSCREAMRRRQVASKTVTTVLDAFVLGIVHRRRNSYFCVRGACWTPAR